MNGEKKRARLDQRRAPIHEALENFRQMRVVPFDVPGHKRGRGNPELTAFLGQQCVGVDVNSMKPLDNLCHPVSVIREAEELAADAFGAAHAFLMVGGTTSSVQSMVLTACKRGDEIILPRNVHRSVLNALVLCGAVPVYVNPEVDQRLGISLGMKREQVAKAIAEHPNAVAVLVNNPTYYGICSDLRAIVRLREADLEDMLENISMPEFMLKTEDGTEVKASDLTADGKHILMFLEEEKEPTEHILNEMMEQEEAFAGYAEQIIFVVRSKEALETPTLSKALAKLKNIQIYYDDFSEIINTLGRRMYVDPDKLPLIIVTNGTLNGIYATSGYNVGTGDMLLRLM